MIGNKDTNVEGTDDKELLFTNSCYDCIVG